MSSVLNVNTAISMAFELAILVVVGLLVYFKLIGSDLLLLAVGAVVRGAFGIIPATSALQANTQATQQNTDATNATKG